MAPLRRTLPEKHIADFKSNILVCCPRCGSQALVKHFTDAANIGSWCLTCPHCGFSKTESEIVTHPKASIKSRERQPWFGAELWLRAEACGEVLWFYNYEHLLWCEDYIRATLRERRSLPGLRNQALSSRLPTWMKLAKNRNELLTAISKMRAG